MIVLMGYFLFDLVEKYLLYEMDIFNVKSCLFKFCNYNFL